MHAVYQEIIAWLNSARIDKNARSSYNYHNYAKMVLKGLVTDYIYIDETILP